MCPAVMTEHLLVPPQPDLQLLAAARKDRCRHVVWFRERRRDGEIGPRDAPFRMSPEGSPESFLEDLIPDRTGPRDDEMALRGGQEGIGPGGVAAVDAETHRKVRDLLHVGVRQGGREGRLNDAILRRVCTKLEMTGADRTPTPDEPGCVPRKADGPKSFVRARLPAHPSATCARAPLAASR